MVLITMETFWDWKNEESFAPAGFWQFWVLDFFEIEKKHMQPPLDYTRL